ncbi:MAG: hypothetical protein Kow0022_15640 [Phycisphaerales bacterium]
MSKDKGFEQGSEVAEAVAGNRDALRALWRTHRAWVAAILLAHKPREAELEDLLQSVALTLVNRIGEVRDQRAFRPWLRTVATNVARASGRRQTIERKARRCLAEAARVRQAGACADEQSREGRRVLELARALPDGYREPLLLRCVKGMSYREIAKVLELPESTIETRIARGRRMLRDLASRQNDDRRPDRTLEGVDDGRVMQ